jgi:hypothetical protein
MNILRGVVDFQQRLSFGFDRVFLSTQMRTDGNTDFAESFALATCTPA